MANPFDPEGFLDKLYRRAEERRNPALAAQRLRDEMAKLDAEKRRAVECAAEQRRRRGARAAKQKRAVETEVLTSISHKEIVAACRDWLKAKRPDVLAKASGIRFHVDDGAIRADVWRKR